MPASRVTYKLISSTTLSATSATVTFTGITSRYTDLVLISSAKNTTSSNSHITIRFNSDSGSNYSSTYMYNTGSGAGSLGSESNLTNGYLARHDDAQYAVGITSFMDYANSTTFKALLSRGGNQGDITQAFVSTWRSTSPITSFILYPNAGSNFASGSSFKLYGVGPEL